MSTREKLLTIDENDFETLVLLYLRRHNSNLRGLIHTGVNAEGRPIKCPVDGVLHVIGPPAELVHVAATIHNPSEIRRKWLGGKKARGKPEPGDLAKAYQEFESWTGEPNATRKLFLGWNRSLENNTDLYRDVKARCKSLGMTVEVIEASQLIDFLDHDPEGQYLRQEFLGISAFRLSESLLRQIAIRSLSYHKQTYGLSVAGDHVEIMRDVVHQLDRVIRYESALLVGIVGASGAGKSTLARQEGMTLNTANGICIWVPVETFVPHMSPASLLLKVLRGFHPKLDERAGDDALEIAASVPYGLILFLDDVNRASLPAKITEAASVYARLDLAAYGAGQRQPRLRFVIPLWPERTPQKTSDNEGMWKTIDLPFYSAAERERLAVVPRQEVNTTILPLLQALGGDPFLCDLALTALAHPAISLSTNRNSILTATVEYVLERGTSEAVASERTATQDEVADALDTLIQLIFATDDPEPSWVDIRASVSSHSSNLLLQLAGTNVIGWVEQRLEASHWRWKHDRLRDAIIGRWLAKKAAAIGLGIPYPDELLKLIVCPGAAEAWAWALVFVDANIRCALIRALAQHQPLALADSLSIMDFEVDELAKQEVIHELQRVLSDYPVDNSTFLEPTLWPVLYRLTRTHEPIVLEITETMNRSWHVDLGRLRNGDTDAGLRLMKRFFDPMMDFPPLSRAISEYVRVQNEHRDLVAKHLLKESENHEQTIPIMALCGYLGWEELTQLTWDIWSRLDEQDKQTTLLPLIWALSRCASQRDQTKLEEALLRARLWDDQDRIEGNVHHDSERYDEFVEPLRFMLKREITEAASQTLAKVATDYDDLTTNMLYILREVDTPATMEEYVRITGRYGGTLLDRLDATDRHYTSKFIREDVPITAASRDRLWQIISSDDVIGIRRVAFWLWKRFIAPEDLNLLQSISPGDELFEEILRARLRLRDRSAASLLIDRINAQPGAWVPYAYTLYNEPGVADALFHNLETAMTSHIIERQYVERIGQNLPPKGLRRLLMEHRDLVLRTPRMWNSLWQSDDVAALNFLRETIPNAQPSDLERFFTRFGDPYFVSQQMLDGISPVLHYFSQEDRDALIRLVVNAGRADWLQRQGFPRKTSFIKRKVRWWLDEVDAPKIFNAAARGVKYKVKDLRHCPYFYEVESQGKKIAFDGRAAIRSWVDRTKTPESVIVAGTLLSTIGVGSDTVWWEQLRPPTNDPSHEIWKRTFFWLRRKRWQAPN